MKQIQDSKEGVSSPGLLCPISNPVLSALRPLKNSRLWDFTAVPTRSVLQRRTQDSILVRDKITAVAGQKVKSNNK